MNIIQITDLHLCRDGEKSFLHADAAQALRHTVDYFLRCHIPMDVVVASGDISNDGSMESYQTALRELEKLPCPVYFVPGNHDDRRHMAQAGLIPTDPNEAACRVVETTDARIILLDSTVDGKSWGQVGSEKMKLLRKYLSEDASKPVLMFMHHVPFITGYTVMDEPFSGVEEFISLISEKKLYICCGHIHAAMTTQIGQANVLTCPPVCMEMEFDLSPQGGDMFYTSEPQFALHTIKGQQVISHFTEVPTGETRKGPYTFSI